MPNPRTTKDGELAPRYSPDDFEDAVYAAWEKSGAFHADASSEKPPFTIVMPPPNITGQLHMGHALDQTLQDLLIRYKRMCGYEALWLPGTDHASIATEVRVAEEIFEREGLTKEQLGREKFLERVWEWKRLYGGKIEDQMRKLGNSCDWERERFTMDEGLAAAVTESFVRYYEEGLIYRGKRLINWCPSCGTSLSDAEVEHEDVESSYWYFRYPSKDGSFSITVATSRPETMFGDTAVAVHPDDERYKALVGKTVLLPLVGRELPIVADPYPDPEKGTGAVKITPAHDRDDFEVGRRHDLPLIEIMNEDGTLNHNAGKYEGVERYEARREWVRELEAAGHLVKTEQVIIPTGKCYRCHDVTEPLMSEQWFLRVDELAKEAGRLTADGELVFEPPRFTKVYERWLEEMRDWCISRQLWWGHRIPAYYCEGCGKLVVAREKPAVCEACGGKEFKQDEDVLDTWFSSALWPFSTLGWPGESGAKGSSEGGGEGGGESDLRRFFPTQVLVTGYDILFFWVVRMAFSSAHFMGKAPFVKVLIHGLIRAADGQKMSKSLGNGVDPLEIIGTYGADALRFTLIQGTAAGNDIRLQVEKIEAARNFANKIWNAARFVLMRSGEAGNGAADKDERERENIADRWMLAKLNNEIKEIRRNIDGYDFSVAAQKIYDFFWGEYCDWFIEFSKVKPANQLIPVLKKLLALLHPFMPFITEEIWSHVKGKSEAMLIASPFPEHDPEINFAEDCETVELAKEIIRAIRNIRAETAAEANKKFPITISAGGKIADRLRDVSDYIKNIAKVTEITFAAANLATPENAKSFAHEKFNLYVLTSDLLDPASKEKERAKLLKEKAAAEQQIAALEKRTSNKNFTEKAPKEIVEKELRNLEAKRILLAKLEERAKNL